MCRNIDNEGEYEKVTVTGERVDALVQQDVLLLKIDVEVCLLPQLGCKMTNKYCSSACVHASKDLLGLQTLIVPPSLHAQQKSRP